MKTMNIKSERKIWVKPDVKVLSFKKTLGGIDPADSEGGYNTFFAS